MITNNENTWNDDVNNQAQGNGSTSFGIPDTNDAASQNYADNSVDDDDDLIGDDLDEDSSLATGDDIPDEEDDLDVDLDDDDDLETDYDETNLDDTEGGGTTGGSYTTGLGDSGPDDPDEIPEERQSDNEGTGYSQQNEQSQQQGGNDASFSEQTDVTPPNQHEFPLTGNPQTDFSSRDHGRSTGRMIGHEPGTEGI